MTQFALRLAADDVVGTHVRQDAIDAVDAAIDGDHRHASLNGLLRAGRHGHESNGLMTMPSTPWMMAASTSAVCLGALFWPSVSTTVIAQRLSLGAKLLLHVDEEREPEARHRRLDRELVLSGYWGCHERSGDRQRRDQSKDSLRHCPLSSRATSGSVVRGRQVIPRSSSTTAVVDNFSLFVGSTVSSIQPRTVKGTGGGPDAASARRRPG